MDRTSAPNYATDGSGLRVYQDRNLSTGVAGTSLIAADRTAIQEEILAVITGCGLAPSASDLGQMWEGLQARFGARVAPQVATSAQGVILGASYSGSESVTFTAPVAGYVYAWGTLNLNVAAGATVLCNLVVNGTTVQSDSTELSQSHQAVVAVTAGESVTVALQVSTGANPSASATYSVGARFEPA